MVNLLAPMANESDEFDSDSRAETENLAFGDPFAPTEEDIALDTQHRRETLQQCRSTLDTLLFAHDPRSDATQQRKNEEFTLHNIRLIDPSFPHPHGARKESGTEYEKITFPALNTPGREGEATKWLKELFKLKAFDQPPETKEEDLRVWKMQDEIAQAVARDPRAFVQLILDQMKVLEFKPGWLGESRVGEMVIRHKFLLEQIYRSILQRACLTNPRVLDHLPTSERDRTIDWLQKKTWTVKMYMQFASCLDKGSANQIFNGIKETEQWKKYGPEMGKAWWDEAMTMLAHFPQAYHKEGRLQMIMSGICTGLVQLPPNFSSEIAGAGMNGKTMADFLRKQKLLAEPDWEHLSQMDTVIKGQLGIYDKNASTDSMLEYIRERSEAYRGLRERMIDAIQKTGVPLRRMPEPPAVPTEMMIEKITRFEKGVTSPDDALAAYAGERARDPNYIRGQTAPAMALAATRRHITCTEAFRFASQHHTDLLTTLSKEGLMKVLRPPAGSDPDDLQEQFEELIIATDRDPEMLVTLLLCWEALAEVFRNPKACRDFQERIVNFLGKYLSMRPTVQGENWAIGGALRFLARFNYPLAQEWAKRLKDYIEFKDALEIAYAPLLYPDVGMPEWETGMQTLENAGNRRTRWHVLPNMVLPQHSRIADQCRALYDELQKVAADAFDENRTPDRERPEDLGRARNRPNDLEEKIEDLRRAWLPRIEELKNDKPIPWRERLFSVLQWGQKPAKPSAEEYATAQKLLEVARRIDSALKGGKAPAELKRELLDSQRWQEEGYTLLTFGTEKPLKNGAVPPLGKFMQSWMREKELAGISLTRKPLPQITAEEYNAQFRAYVEPIRQQRKKESRRSFLKKAAAAGIALAVGKGMYDMLTNLEPINRNGRSDGTLPGGESSSLPGVEAMEENPAVVARLSRMLHGNDQYMFHKYLSYEDPETSREMPMSDGMGRAIAALGPAVNPELLWTACQFMRVRNGSRLALPLGAHIREHYMVTQTTTSSVTPDGFTVIGMREPGGPYSMLFHTSPPPTINGGVRAAEIARKLSPELRPLLQISFDREYLPDELRNAVTQAEREPAAAAIQTIARAVRGYLEYDDTVGQTYRDFHAQAPHRPDHGSPYVEFICRQRKGVCGQFARLTQELLRHAGIPSLQGDCLWAQEQTITTNHFHRVAVAIILDTNGNLIRVPVESTGSSVRRRQQEVIGREPEREQSEQIPQERPQERRPRQKSGPERGLIPDNMPPVAAAIGALLAGKGIQKIRDMIRDRTTRPAETPTQQEKPTDIPEKKEMSPAMQKPDAPVSAPVKEKAPEFFLWWQAIVHEAFRETARDPDIVCPDTESCLLYMKVRTRVREKLKTLDPATLPPDFITQATDMLKASAESAYHGKKQGLFWLEKPQSEGADTE